MKQKLVLLLISLITISLNAQSAVGKIKLRPEYWQTNMKKGDFEKIQNSKTYFVIPEQLDYGYTTHDYEALIKEFWTVTPIEIITNEQVEDILEIGAVLIRFRSISLSISKRENFEVPSRAVKTLGFNYFRFGQINKIKKTKKGEKKWWEDFFGIISFSADVEARVEMSKMKDTVHGDLLDYRKGYIKNYFQQVNNAIETSTNDDFYDDVTNKSELNKLKNQTLYIPENILYRFNALTRKEKERPSEELFKDYSYQFNVINEDKLSDMILDTKEPFYYLMYHQKNAHKIITIVEASTGKIIYRRSKNLSYNMKPKDIKAINKSISRK